MTETKEREKKGGRKTNKGLLTRQKYMENSRGTTKKTSETNEQERRKEKKKEKNKRKMEKRRKTRKE